MDPNATWDRIRDAIRDGDYECFAAACEDLQYWVERGGVYPRAWGDHAGAWLVWLSYVTTYGDQS